MAWENVEYEIAEIFYGLTEMTAKREAALAWYCEHRRVAQSQAWKDWAWRWDYKHLRKKYKQRSNPEAMRRYYAKKGKVVVNAQERFHYARSQRNNPRSKYYTGGHPTCQPMNSSKVQPGLILTT